MKIQLDYLSRILKVFLEASTAHITVKDFNTNELKAFRDNTVSEEFLFHFQLLLDRGLISNRVGDLCDLEMAGIRFSLDDSFYINEVLIRLTADGHDFAEALNNQEVLAKLKAATTSFSLETILRLSQNILEKVVMAKIGSLMG